MLGEYVVWNYNTNKRRKEIHTPVNDDEVNTQFFPMSIHYKGVTKSLMESDILYIIGRNEKVRGKMIRV